MNKFKNQLLPNNCNIFFTSIKEIHNYNTKLSSKMTYALPKTRTNYGIFNIRYQGAKICHSNIKFIPSRHLVISSISSPVKILMITLILSFTLQLYLNTFSGLPRKPSVIFGNFWKSSRIFVRVTRFGHVLENLRKTRGSGRKSSENR